MFEKRASLEVIAPSVEEAIAKGLGDLGLKPDDVDVEILDSGSRGLFGIGSRQARVRLTIKGAAPEAEREQPEATATEAEPPASTFPVQPQSAPQFEPAATASKHAPAEPVEPAAGVAVAEESEENREYVLRVARETVSELLEKMKVRASVTTRMGEPEDAHSKAPLLVDVRGNDLSILIGPRAETLNALQYIAGLIVGKELGRSIPLVVDVEGYRARREQQIRQLARRMADQAMKTGKRQVLEPMPANERRLIHIELRSNPNVDTESIGEEPRRKVTIFPKEEA